MDHEVKYDGTLYIADIVSLKCNCFLNDENLSNLCRAHAVLPNYISQLVLNSGSGGNEPKNVPANN